MMRVSCSEFVRCSLLVTVILSSLPTGHWAFAADKDKPSRPAVGDEATDFELKTLDAQTIQLSKLVAQGPVVLIVLRGYPGYQCPVCNSQAGQFLAKAKQFDAAQARVVMVYPGPADGLKKRAEEFLRDRPLPENFFLVLDPDYEFTKSYRLRWEAKNETAYPAAFVIDRERKIRFAKISTTHGGRASAAEVLKALPPK